MTQTIEQLTARVRELEERRCEICGYAEHHREHTGCLRTQLAAEQLNNKLLREALEAVIKVHGYESGIPVEAISTQTSTEALDKYVAEKVKEYGDEARRQMQHATKAVWQRDLAVDAMEKAASVMWKSNDNLDIHATEIEAAISTIKES